MSLNADVDINDCVDQPYWIHPYVFNTAKPYAGDSGKYSQVFIPCCMIYVINKLLPDLLKAQRIIFSKISKLFFLSPVSVKRTQVFYTFGCLKPCRHLLPLSSISKSPHKKMQMWKSRITGFTAKPYHLSNLYRIAGIYQRTIILQMPITGRPSNKWLG